MKGRIVCRSINLNGCNLSTRKQRGYGGTYGEWIEEKPFQASGISDNNSFLVAIKIAKDSNIKYLQLEITWTE